MRTLHATIEGPAGAPVVLLLHGLGSCGDDWGPQVPALIERYRVLVVDLPAHRHSPPTGGVPSIARMAAAVERVLDGFGIDRAHVVGLSLGGCVALSLAVQASARVLELVVYNGMV